MMNGRSRVAYARKKNGLVGDERSSRFGQKNVDRVTKEYTSNDWTTSAEVYKARI